MRSVVRVGIPRALAFYDYGSLWMQFFAELNIQAVISPPTNRSIVDIGGEVGHRRYLSAGQDLLRSYSLSGQQVRLGLDFRSPHHWSEKAGIYLSEIHGVAGFGSTRSHRQG